MTYDPRLTKAALVKRRPAPEPGTPEANPAATLIEPKAKYAGRRRWKRRDPEDPALWVALAPNDGRRSPRAVVPMPTRVRVVRTAVGTADRYAGGTVRGSEWNTGWRWKLGVACAVVLGLFGVALVVGTIGVIEFIQR